MTSPPRIELTWTDPVTGRHGYVAVDSLVRGVAAGGLRVRDGCSPEEIRGLAHTMGLKEALAFDPADRYRPVGGAKGGIDAHPDDPEIGAIIRRLIQLLPGLWLYGTSMAMMIRSQLGLNPWDVLHQGIAGRTPLSFGTVTALTGAVVLLSWLPLRQRLGIGTVANVLIIAIAVDVTLTLLPAPDWWLLRGLLLIGGVTANGLATASYVGARLGPGPRDGLMTGLHQRTGRSLRLVRTVLELAVLAIGWLLGGTVGVGTVLYALAIGPLSQAFLPLVAVRLAPPPRPAAES